MKKKVIFAVTNCDQYNDGTPTGLWLSELTHYWDAFEKEGFEMVLISPKGGKSPLEPKSLKGMAFDKSARMRHQDRTFMEKLEQTTPAAEVDWKDYDAICYTGGHGVMYDFPSCDAFHTLNRNMIENNRVVSAVCHGYCGIADTKLSDDSYMIEGKSITGFSWLEERLAGVSKKVPYNVEDDVKNKRAQYSKALLPFLPYVKTDKNLVTGQNPPSAKKTAEATLKAIYSQVS